MTTRGSLARGLGKETFQGRVQKWVRKLTPVGGGQGARRLTILKWVPTGAAYLSYMLRMYVWLYALTSKYCCYYRRESGSNRSSQMATHSSGAHSLRVVCSPFSYRSCTCLQPLSVHTADVQPRASCGRGRGRCGAVRCTRRCRRSSARPRRRRRRRCA